MKSSGTIAAAFVPAMVPAIVLAFALCAQGAPGASGAEIAAPKLALIRQAMTSMKLDARVHALVASRVEAKVSALRALNPGMSDSLSNAAHAVIAGVYDDNLEAPDGLFSRVYAVLDRRLGDDDLRFVRDFHGSDQGRRYKEMVPRIVSECVEEGRAWADGLEPAVRARLETALRGADIRY